jgi:hypothetical protein
MHSPACAIHKPRVSTAHRPFLQRLCAVIFILLFAVSSLASTVFFPLHNSAGQPAYLTEVDLQAVSFPIPGNSNYTIIGDSLPYQTDLNGLLTVTNLETNIYLVTQHGFTTNTMWFINVASFGATYTNNQITIAFTNAVNDGTMAYSIAGANATFPAFVNAGTNVTTQTNIVGGLIQVTVNASSSGLTTNLAPAQIFIGIAAGDICSRDCINIHRPRRGTAGDVEADDDVAAAEGLVRVEEGDVRARVKLQLPADDDRRDGRARSEISDGGEAGRGGKGLAGRGVGCPKRDKIISDLQAKCSNYHLAGKYVGGHPEIVKEL